VSRLPPWHWRLPAPVAHAFGLVLLEGQAGATFARDAHGRPQARADGVLPNGEAERALMELPGCAHDGQGWVWTGSDEAVGQERAS